MILEREIKLLILGDLGMPGHLHLKLWHHFGETFYVYLQAKKQLHPSIFLEILKRYQKLVILGILGMPGYTHTQN